MKKRILVVGSGGREYALGWKLKQSPHVGNIFFANGNGGTHEIGKNVPISPLDIPNLRRFALENSIDLTVVGPDDSLALGIVDDFRKHHLTIFGPTKKAAKIEWSKSFAKQLMHKDGIPTAQYRSFTSLTAAKQYVKDQSLPIVIKASGLALGKGVVIAKTYEEAFNTLEKIMRDKIFGTAGKEVVIEEYLSGQEISIHVLTDGKHHVTFPIARDHKPIGNNNRGPNTGGMGTIAPVPHISSSLMQTIETQIINPLLNGLRKRNIIYSGCLYPGLMITKNGPKVLECNARFGDPETQSYMRLLSSDLYELLLSCTNGTLNATTVAWKKQYACCIILASKGYPATSHKNDRISGLAQRVNKDIVIFHAGTKKVHNNIVTNGGRVLGISATGNTIMQATKKAYQRINKIHFYGMQFRSDIGNSH